MTAAFEQVACPMKGCNSGLFKVDAYPRLWKVYCAVEGCGSIIMDVSKPHIIPMLWAKYGLDQYEEGATR